MKTQKTRNGRGVPQCPVCAGPSKAELAELGKLLAESEQQIDALLRSLPEPDVAFIPDVPAMLPCDPCNVCPVCAREI